MRWLVFASLVFSVIIAFRGYILKKPFSGFYNALRHWTATIAHVQLVIGLWLYFVSPVISYFLHNYSDAVHQREVRFFGMEHSLMMVVAIVVITIGSIKTKRREADIEKFRTMATWYTVALLIILVMIPWGFSPLASRPYFRAPF